MKTLLITALVLITLSLVSGSGIAQRKGAGKEPARGTAVYEHEMTAKVTKVDPAAKTLTVLIQGKSITFAAPKLSKLPTAGKMVDITYTWNPDKPPTAVSVREAGAKEATGEEKGQARQNYTHCSDSPGHHHDPFVTLKLKGGCPWW